MKDCTVWAKINGGEDIVMDAPISEDDGLDKVDYYTSLCEVWGVTAEFWLKKPEQAPVFVWLVYAVIDDSDRAMISKKDTYYEAADFVDEMRTAFAAAPYNTNFWHEKTEKPSL